MQIHPTLLHFGNPSHVIALGMASFCVSFLKLPKLLMHYGWLVVGTSVGDWRATAPSDAATIITTQRAAGNRTGSIDPPNTAPQSAVFSSINFARKVSIFIFYSIKMSFSLLNKAILQLASSKIRSASAIEPRRSRKFLLFDLRNCTSIHELSASWILPFLWT